jgi:hypothetical protein
VRCRAGAPVATTATGVPVLRSSVKNAASRPGHESCDSNFKQPRLRILAAQCVRGLPVPREPREGMERWEAPGHQWAPLRRVVNPPRAARQPRAPKARRSASQRSTGHQAVDHSGAPRSGQLSLCPMKGSPLESGPPHRTGREQDKRGFGDGDRYRFTIS